MNNNLKTAAGIGSAFFLAIIAYILYRHQQDSLKGLPTIKLTIVGTNDIHGKYYSSVLSRSDNHQKYGFGGLQVMAKMIQILKDENPQHFLYLDGGDQFQGGFQSSSEISSGEIIADYLNHMGLAAGAVGNHEFDFGPQFLQNYLQKLHNDIVSANLVDSSTQEQDAKHFPLYHQKPSTMYSFPVPYELHEKTKIRQIKIGVIGLSTLQTLYTSSGFTQKMFPSTYQFLKYTEVVENETKKLKQKGANAIILLCHVGNNCGRNNTFGNWTENNMGNLQSCKKDDEIFTLLDSLPSGTIDMVVQGHRHSTNHFFYKKTPIIGSVNDGDYFNVAYLNFVLQQDKVLIDDEATVIEGPIPVCEKVFKNTKKCQFVKSEDLQSAGKLVRNEFHGVKVQKDHELAELASQKWGKKMQQFQIQIAANYIPFTLEKTREAQNPLGNLVTNLIAKYMERKKYSFSFIVMNAGGFRSMWFPGIIQYAELRSMFPFDDNICLFDIKGKDLKTMIETIQNGKKAFYPQWGLSQVFNQSKTDNKLNLIQLVLADGTPILDNQVYTGATVNFLIEGGDDFKDVRSLLTNVRKLELIRDVIKEQLQQMGEITEDDLKNPGKLDRLVLLK